MKTIIKFKKLKVLVLSMIIMLISSSMTYAGVGGEIVGKDLEEENLQLLEECLAEYYQEQEK